jgi:hypothetical protein
MVDTAKRPRQCHLSGWVQAIFYEGGLLSSVSGSIPDSCRHTKQRHVVKTLEGCYECTPAAEWGEGHPRLWGYAIRWDEYRPTTVMDDYQLR